MVPPETVPDNEAQAEEEMNGMDVLESGRLLQLETFE